LFKKLLTYKQTLLNLFWRSLQIIARNGFSYIIFYLSSLFLLKEDFGYYNYILKISFFLSLFVDFGISMAAGKYTAEFDTVKSSNIKPMMSNNIIFILIVGITVTLVTLLLNYTFFNQQYSDILYLCPLFILVPLTSLYDAVFRGLRKFRELSLITLITGSLSVAGFYFLIKYFGLKGAFFSQNLFYFLMLIGLGFKYGHVAFSFNKEIFYSTIRYALIIGVIGLFMFFSTQVDVLFLGYYGYYTEVAYYEIIFRFLSFIMMPFAIIGHVISPDFTRQYTLKNYHWIRKRLKNSILFSFVSSLFIWLILYYIFPFIFEYFFTKYNSAELHKMSNIMLILFFSNMLNGFIPLLAIATGHARWGMYFIVVVGILNLLFDYISITYWGVWGLIYSTVILKSMANICFIGYYYFKIPRG